MPNAVEYLKTHVGRTPPSAHDPLVAPNPIPSITLDITPYT
jgi:hypothetical protein